MLGKRSRVISRGFKLEAVARMDAGENVSRLARELGVRRKLLYEWRDAWRAAWRRWPWRRGHKPRRSAFIPKLADKDPFDRLPLTARQARFAPWCEHHKRTAT